MLIGFGVLLLLSNLGVFPESGWAVLWRFWPVALVALGLDVLIGRRSLGGVIASGVLILISVGMLIGLAFRVTNTNGQAEVVLDSYVQGVTFGQP